MSQQMLDEFARENLAKLIELGNSIKKRLPNRKDPRDALEKARKSVREADLELQGCQPRERRQFEQALREAEAELKMAELFDTRGDALEWDIDDFHSELQLVCQECSRRLKENRDRFGNGGPQMAKVLEADAAMVNHILTAWSSYRCPNPESAEALDDHEQRLTRLLERLQAVVDEPERRLRAELVHEALHYGICPDGLSNLELRRRIDSYWWAELAAAE
jgi:hypothetical protein